MLLTDDSPRLRAALKYMIYGRRGVFDADRLIDVLTAFENYERTSQATQVGVPELSQAALARQSRASREALQFILSPKGAFFRELVLDECVKGIDAAARIGAASALAAVLPAGLRALPLPLLLPLPGAVRAPTFGGPAVTADDELVVRNMAKILAFLGQGREQPGAGAAGRFVPAGALAAVGSDSGFGTDGGFVREVIARGPLAAALAAAEQIGAGGGGGAGVGGQQGRAQAAQALTELAPMLPALAVEVLPELGRRLSGRMLSRFIRDTYVGVAAA